jgi:hypothetical protein
LYHHHHHHHHHQSPIIQQTTTATTTLIFDTWTNSHESSSLGETCLGGRAGSSHHPSIFNYLLGFGDEKNLVALSSSVAFSPSLPCTKLETKKKQPPGAKSFQEGLEE